MNLLIVESPAKAKTIEEYLGKDYKVLASFGHIRDLPRGKFGIDKETLEPDYVIPTKARKKVTELKKASAEATKIILAPDEDREGEAIAKHVMIATEQPKEKYERITFNEITKEAILEAVKNPRNINEDLFNAQQGRRVLDRLIGYSLSPLLKKKLRNGISAGRVQSVALKFIIDREREIKAFEPDEYWEIFANLNKNKNFISKLIKENNKKIEVKNKKKADEIVEKTKNEKFIVKSVTKSEKKRNPYAPFTTSTLQQEAARKLRYSAKKTMVLAQKLYEGVKLPDGKSTGLITYMRTDSTHLSNRAINEIRNIIEKDYGKEYLPENPKVYKSKKGAQEAHEAIRPTSFLRKPKDLKDVLESDMLKVYTIIWKRALSSQMNPEILDLVRVDIRADDCTFRANGKQVKFDGFSKVYLEGKEKKQIEDSKEIILPNLLEGDECKLLNIDPQQKFTQPPARYTEASLVKTMEEHGIGRPSTYTPTISTIKDRGYVAVENRYFIPQEIGFMVNDLLEKNFPEIVNVKFTAKMEEDLDKIAEGEIEWKKPIKDFWFPFEKEVEASYDKIEKVNMDEETDEICEKCGKPMLIKAGRFGRFMACSGFPECKNTKTIQNKTGQKCPECKKGDVIIKKTKRGKTFWGCSNYPECEWASWEAPKSED